MIRNHERTPSRFLALVLVVSILPVAAPIVGAQESTPLELATIIWPPADVGTTSELGDFIIDRLNLSEAIIIGTTAIDSFSLEQIDQRSSRVRVMYANGSVQSFVQTHRTPTIHEFGYKTDLRHLFSIEPKHVDRPILHLWPSRDPYSLTVVELVVPPGSVNVTVTDPFDSLELREAGKRIGTILGLPAPDLEGTGLRTDWSGHTEIGMAGAIDVPYSITVGYPAVPLLGERTLCLTTATAPCAASAMFDLKCDCPRASGAVRPQPAAGLMARDGSDIRVGANGNGGALVFDDAGELVYVRLDLAVQIHSDRLLLPTAARAKVAAFLEAEGYEMGEKPGTELDFVVLDLARPDGLNSPTNATYTWRGSVFRPEDYTRLEQEVGKNWTLGDTGFILTQNALTGEVMEVETYDAFSHGDDEDDGHAIPIPHMTVLLGLIGVVALIRARRPGKHRPT